MARFTGPNRQQQAELKRLHKEGKSAKDVADKMQIDFKSVQNWFKHFEKGGTISNPAKAIDGSGKEGSPPAADGKK